MHGAHADPSLPLAIAEARDLPACSAKVSRGLLCQSVRASSNADLSWLCSSRQPLVDGQAEPIKLLLSAGVADGRRCRAVKRGAVAGERVGSRIEVIEGSRGEQAERPAEDLVRCTVVQA